MSICENCYFNSYGQCMNKDFDKKKTINNCNKKTILINNKEKKNE